MGPRSLGNAKTQLLIGSDRITKQLGETVESLLNITDNRQSLQELMKLLMLMKAEPDDKELVEEDEFNRKASEYFNNPENWPQSR